MVPLLGQQMSNFYEYTGTRRKHGNHQIVMDFKSLVISKEVEMGFET
jgi:hypothetical protein